jgi:pimeloyl-ACP methyl ester carboxylesterase
MTPVRTPAAGMLLIHGAWQGSWAWDAWLPELAARGWTVRAVDLPGNGANPSGDAGLEVSLQTYVGALTEALAGFDGPVVVVAHSGAGVPASQLAEALPERVACLVYVAGMMLPSGMGYAELVDASAADVPNAGGIAPYLQWRDEGAATIVPPEAALEIFLHDRPPEAARQAALKLTSSVFVGRWLCKSAAAIRTANFVARAAGHSAALIVETGFRFREPERACGTCRRRPAARSGNAIHAERWQLVLRDENACRRGRRLGPRPYGRWNGGQCSRYQRSPSVAAW